MTIAVSSLDRILVPVDFGDASKAALALATTWASAGGARVDVVHVIDTPSFLEPQATVAFGTTGAVTTLDDVVRREAHGRMNEVIEALPPSAAATVNTDIVMGDPLKVIIERSPDADLIVIGTHAKPGLGRWMLGTLADRILRSVDGPVVTVHDTDEPKIPKDLLVAVDGSAGSREALKEAAVFRDHFGGSIRALHVVAQPHAAQGLYIVANDDARVSFEEHLRATCSAEIEQFVFDTLGAVPVRIDIEIGSPGDLIPVAAEAADLVLMGTRGMTGLERIAMGSVATRVARHAPCPVLTVRRASDRG